mmetsp:Transcript_23164/g.69662  ORF Transcript_23164/g.69662 Transcript_23164/m.69662 type:complete len:361 (-) Transcript_23164:74-1156(-)
MDEKGWQAHGSGLRQKGCHRRAESQLFLRGLSVGLASLSSSQRGNCGGGLRRRERTERMARQAVTRFESWLTGRRHWTGGAVSAWRDVPPQIARPSYARTGLVSPGPAAAAICDAATIERLRRAGRLARRVLDYACSLAAPGVSTDAIDALVHDRIVAEGAYPAPYNYMGFPKSLCASPNDVICHGIPDSRVLADGDVVSFDASVFVDGVFGDNCGTVCVGGVDDAGRRLVDATRDALAAALDVVRPGACLTEIGDACSDVADARGYGVVRQYCGHGIGTTFHAPPLVSHARNRNVFRLEAGHVFTIEPMLTEGSPDLYVAGDGWTVLTRDGRRAAQFEHTVLVTDDGHEVLTEGPPLPK